MKVGNPLRLQIVETPRSALIESVEREFGRFTRYQEFRYFLADIPVDSGALLERFHNGEWVRGRFEWTGRPHDPPTFVVDGKFSPIEAESLFRRPEQEI